jgi:hypothetical protein
MRMKTNKKGPRVDEAPRSVKKSTRTGGFLMPQVVMNTFLMLIAIAANGFLILLLEPLEVWNWSIMDW